MLPARNGNDSSSNAIRYGQFRTTDSATAGRFFAGAYTPGWRISSLARGTAVTHRRFEADCVTVDELLVEGRVGWEIRPADSVVVVAPRAGSLTTPGDSGTRLDTAVLAADGLPCVLQANTARFHVVSMNLQLVTYVAAERSGPLAQRVQFLDCRPRTDAVAQAWSQALDYVIASFGCAETAGQPLIVAAAARLLGAALLECFPSNLHVDRELLSNPTLPPNLKVAVSFIHRHCGDGIGVNDIADALRMTPRAVQYLFRQHLGTTPTEYLRRTRLQRAHQDLSVGDRSTTTVAEIAQRWGFTHTGRFAAVYRASYGQSPHTTLQQ